MKKISIIVIIIFTAFLGCENNTGPDNESPAPVRGVVIDSTGNPVPDVAIFLNYNLVDIVSPSKAFFEGIDPEPPIDSTQLYGNFPNPFSNTTTIRFFIDEPDTVNIWIEDFTHIDTITLLESHLPAGHYQHPWDARDNSNLNLESGVYLVSLLAGATADSFSMFLNREGYSEFSLDRMRIKVETDTLGRFSIPQESLPFDYTGMEIDVYGFPIGQFAVTRYIDIWALHESYNAAHIDSVFVDPILGANIEIEL